MKINISKFVKKQGPVLATKCGHGHGSCRPSGGGCRPTNGCGGGGDMSGGGD